VISSQGGGSKDTWVLADEEMPAELPSPTHPGAPPLSTGRLRQAAGPQIQDQQ